MVSAVHYATPLIGGLLLLASKDKRPTVQVRISEDAPRHTNGPILENTCPQCAEHVRVDAKICRFCRHAF